MPFLVIPVIMVSLLSLVRIVAVLPCHPGRYCDGLESVLLIRHRNYQPDPRSLWHHRAARASARKVRAAWNDRRSAASS